MAWCEGDRDHSKCPTPIINVQIVSVDNKISNFLPVNSGVPQGNIQVYIFHHIHQ